MPTLSEVVDLLHGWFPPDTAEDWDAVGLVAGDPNQPIRRIGFAVEPRLDVVEEAVTWGADLLVVHHPLFLKAVHGVPRTTPKGRTLGALSDGGCALLTAHTNADRAVGGVSEALALALGLTGLEPVVASEEPRDTITVFVPAAQADAVRDALAAAGAGAIGDYDAASFTSEGEGRFRPLPGARPTVGEIGRLEVVDEVRIEAVLPRAARREVVRAMLAVHPYEEPAWDLVRLDDAGVGAVGAGRIGDVEPTTLAAFADRVAAVLPRTAAGVRVGGDSAGVVRRVAVCGGAGDFLLADVARTDADVFVTSDLRHHPAAEFLERGGAALVDVAHWAAEWTWLPLVEARVRDALGDAGDDTVETRVSTIVTDPWSFRADPTNPEETP